MFSKFDLFNAEATTQTYKPIEPLISSDSLSLFTHTTAPRSNYNKYNYTTRSTSIMAQNFAELLPLVTLK